ncbi:6-bladed beta-propeller [Candidatus Zixiibacteriota bacterium]
MSRLFTTGVSVFLILSMIGCSGTGEISTTHSFDSTVEEGVTIVKNTGGPKYDGELFEYEPMVTLQEDDREESLLFNPAGFIMDESGYFYVVDSGNRRIAVFDPDGRYSHAIGREGNGPGEFQLVRIESIKGDTLTTHDLMLQRISRFQTDGTLIDTNRLRSEGMQISLSKCVMLPGDLQLQMGVQADPNEGMGANSMLIQVSAIDASGDITWSIQTPYVHVMSRIMVTIGGQEMPMPLFVPFGPVPWVTYHDRHGIVISPGNGPVLDVYSVDGNHRFHIDVAVQEELASDSELDNYRDYLREQMVNNEFMKPMFEAQLAHLPNAAVKAPWRDIEVDDAGFFWLKYPTTMLGPSSMDSVATYRVLSPQGEYLGVSTTPFGNLPRISHGMLLVSHMNPETDEQTLVAYAIRPIVRGLDYP